MYMRFTWAPGKKRMNPRKHRGITFEMAQEVFDDPNQVVLENYEDDSEQRFQIIGMTRDVLLLLVVFVDRSEEARKSSTSSRQERRRHMRRASTKINSDKRIHISPETRALYRKRDTSVDNADPDAPVLPPELWENAIVGKFYRPKKTAITFRIDNDVLRWLKSKGKGHLGRINEILRQHMTGELKS